MADDTNVVPPPPIYTDQSELNPGHYYQPLVLDRIFSLLVLMIDVLQKGTAAQANRLNLLTSWQKAYTDKMNQIHAFVAGNGDGHTDFSYSGLDSGSPQAAAIRQDLNTANTSFTQQMQGNLQVVSNDAKQLQTNINQSNDAVQSQTDMATAVLQQLSTILTSIYQQT